jgi:hypothetical protein
MGFLLLVALLALAFFSGRWYAESQHSRSAFSAGTVNEVAEAVRPEYPEAAFVLDEVKRSVESGLPLSSVEIASQLRRLYPRRVIGNSD